MSRGAPPRAPRPLDDFRRGSGRESVTAKSRVDRAADRRRSRASVDDQAVVLDAAAAFLSVRPRSVDETRRRLRHLGYRSELVDSVVARLTEMGYLDDATFARAWVESRDRARPRGAAALRRELILKGVDRSTIDRVLEERDAGGSRQPPASGLLGHDAGGSRKPPAGASHGRDASLAANASDRHATTDTDDALHPSGEEGAARSAEEAAARRVLERRLPALLRERDERRRWQKAYALLARSGFDPDTCAATIRSVFRSPGS